MTTTSHRSILSRPRPEPDPARGRGGGRAGPFRPDWDSLRSGYQVPGLVRRRQVRDLHPLGPLLRPRLSATSGTRGRCTGRGRTSSAITGRRSGRRTSSATRTSSPDFTGPPSTPSTGPPCSVGPAPSSWCRSASITTASSMYDSALTRWNAAAHGPRARRRSRAGRRGTGAVHGDRRVEPPGRALVLLQRRDALRLRRGRSGVRRPLRPGPARGDPAQRGLLGGLARPHGRDGRSTTTPSSSGSTGGSSRTCSSPGWRSSPPGTTTGRSHATEPVAINHKYAAFPPGTAVTTSSAARTPASGRCSGRATRPCAVESWGWIHGQRVQGHQP